MIKAIDWVINGRRIEASTHDASRTLSVSSDKEVRVPRLTDSHVSEILSFNNDQLLKVPLHELINFLYTVGQRWKNLEYARRRSYIRNLKTYLGYSEEMAKLEANWIAMILSVRSSYYDTVIQELGSRHILDRWVDREESQVRAYPRGRCVHLLSGNVPVAGIISIIRALLTKNQCIIKPSADDPFTAAALALSFNDVDPEHPVSKALSVVYWSHKDEAGPERGLMAGADVVCAWGGGQAMQWAQRNTPVAAELLKFGPKRSLAIVTDDADPEETARRLAHDVCAYDQRACFSVQQVFYLGADPALFVENLRTALSLYSQILPRGRHEFDDAAAVALAAAEARFSDARVHHSENHDWTIIVADPRIVGMHPLGRTIYVHPIQDIAEVRPFVNSSVQTVAVAPWSSIADLRDDLAPLGISRLVELGMNNIFRIGGGHDGMFPLQKLVRFVNTEMPSDMSSKDVSVTVDQTLFLEEDRFLEFVP